MQSNVKDQEEMFSKYPVIFQDRTKPMTQTCMCWGLDIGKGWYGIIDDLCERLEWVRKTTGIKIVADQVKEKYASLRFYKHEEFPKKMPRRDAAMWAEIIDNFVNIAEDKSSITCDSCGTNISGAIEDKRWSYAMCEKCKIELDRVREQRAIELVKVIVNKKNKKSNKKG